VTLTGHIKEKATELGFDLVGVAPARRALHAEAYHRWLEQGYHGELSWLENAERRTQPRAVWPGAHSVIALGVSYYTEDPEAAYWNDPARGRIARYAWGKDYHDVLTPKLKALSAFIRDEAPGTRARYYVDTGPVLERNFAGEAGIAFIGRNTMAISPHYGSYIFLAVILVDRELECDLPAEEAGASLPFTTEEGYRKRGSCGQCRRCLDICPTHAFPAPYILDSNRCISYLTIELKGAIPPKWRPRMGNWIFGCDECQSVCPWVHRYSKPSTQRFLRFDPEWAAPRLTELMALDERGFRNRFRGTPLMRSKRRGILRNVAVALGNWGHPEAEPVLKSALRDPEPLIRTHARWALERIRA